MNCTLRDNMRPNPNTLSRASAIALLLYSGAAFSVHCETPQYVELTAEIETVWWSGHGTQPPSVNPYTFHARCVVGTNTGYPPRLSLRL
jgi:hypothetical protein